MLVSEKIAKQNVEWNNSIVVTSNLDSDIYYKVMFSNLCNLQK
ncbi:hypothetical protein [Spiroplasma endosymbiont of Dactylopius coccus]